MSWFNPLFSDFAEQEPIIAERVINVEESTHLDLVRASHYLEQIEYEKNQPAKEKPKSKWKFWQNG